MLGDMLLGWEEGKNEGDMKMQLLCSHSDARTHLVPAL